MATMASYQERELKQQKVSNLASSLVALLSIFPFVVSLS
jgi:hypothetical protein